MSMILSIQGGRVTRYLWQKRPSDLIPFKGNFPILEDYQREAYYKEVQSHSKLEDCVDWVQEAILKADQIYLIETAFKAYLEKANLTKDFPKMKSEEKATILVRFLDSQSLGLERLNIK